MARVIFGPDGSLYGTTYWGGGYPCPAGNGCGTVFKLTPPARTSPAAMEGWTETVLYRFTGGSDGAYPYFGDLLFDQQPLWRNRHDRYRLQAHTSQRRMDRKRYL